MQEELRSLILPAAAGSIVMVLSNVRSVLYMGNKFRYVKKGPDGKPAYQHPYMPWTSDMSDKIQASEYRCYKATQNQNEWLLYTLPLLLIYTLYGGSIPFVGKFTPYVSVSTALAWAYFNGKYAETYAESAEARIPAFKARTNAVKVLLLGAAAGMLCACLRSFGVALPA